MRLPDSSLLHHKPVAVQSSLSDVRLDQPSAPLINMSGVYFERDHRTILSDIDLNVFENDFIAITGPNGGGKTTLLRLMLRLLKPSRGHVVYASDLKRSIGYLPQKNLIDSHFPITVSEVIASGLLGSGLSKEASADKIANVISTLGLDDHARNSIGTLSGGQLQRALLGRALICTPRLLVLDEPLSYLDKNFEHRLYELLEQVRRTTAIVLVSHEMTVIAEMANRHLIVDRSAHECHASHHYVRTDCD